MRRRKFAILWAATMIGVGAGLVIQGGPALAAGLRYVSPSGDDIGDCTVNPCKTIVYAIGQSVSGDTLQIAAGTYPEELMVHKSLSFMGAGSKSTVIDGSGSGRVMTIGSSSKSITVVIMKLTIRGGNADRGAGLLSVPGQGQINRVTLVRVAVSGNSSVGLCGGGPTGWGGGIYNDVASTMLVSRSAISSNSAIGATCPGVGGAGRGGGIFNAGKLTLKTSTISGNQAVGGRGQGSHNSGGGGQGGGILNTGGLTVSRSTISGNLANGGGAIGGFGHAGDGVGGGIGGPVALTNATVVENRAVGGGGSFGGLAGNGIGGGIAASTGRERLRNSTVAANQAIRGAGRGAAVSSGGGLGLLGGQATLTNSILAKNQAVAGPDCDGTANSAGHNLLGNDSSCTGFNGSGDLVNVDPLLGPLQDNGGPTFTMALLDGSPGIDAADDTVCAAPPVKGIDQRGVRRPQGPNCDIGAYEKKQ